MSDTIQFPLEGGGAVALPLATLADAFIPHLMKSLSRAMVADVITPPAPGTFWPEQGGYYLGPRLIDGKTHHRVMAAAAHHLRKVKFEDIQSKIQSLAGAEGFNDWKAADKEDVMLAYINCRQRFPQSGTDSIYWTSAPCGSTSAWALDFECGDVLTWYRRYAFAVLPVRSIIS
ncbi:hypothetical protein [Achromobacter aloeverae]